VRGVAKSFSKDYWSQPRLFFNSLVPEEKQFLINAMRFETAHLQSDVVKKNVISQLNKIHNTIASQVAEVLGMSAPSPDPTFYHENKTASVTIFGTPLLKLTGLKIGVLTNSKAIDTATVSALQSALTGDGVKIVVVGETLGKGVDTTYSSADAIDFDGVVVGKGAQSLFKSATDGSSSLYPAGRPLQILLDAYRYGKPVGFASDGDAIIQNAGIPAGPGVYGVTGKGSRMNYTLSEPAMEKRADTLASDFKEGLKTFRFLNRFAVQK